MSSSTGDVRATSMRLNGAGVSIEARSDETLLESLRHLGLTSVREACAVGICGSCTVLVDGKAVSSCLKLTVLCGDRDVVTSEGLLEDDGELDEVQQAFVESSAFQCSYCIPGMVMAVRALLDEVDRGAVVDTREYLSGNLCRCGSYPQILEAVEALLGRGARAEGSSG